MANEEDKKRAKELFDQVLELIDKKDWDGVRALLKEGLRLDLLGLIDKEDWDGMIALLDKVISRDPKNDRPWSTRGFAKGNLGQHEDAIKDYDEAIRLNPDDDVAWNNRGFAKGRLGQHEDAIKDYDEAIRLNPDSGAAWNNRGATKRKLKQYEDAIKDYDKAIELNSNDASTWNNRALAKFRLGMFDDAEKDMNEALRLKPGDDDIQIALLAIAARKAAEEAKKNISENIQKKEGKRSSILLHERILARESCFYMIRTLFLSILIFILIIVLVWIIITGLGLIDCPEKILRCDAEIFKFSAETESNASNFYAKISNFFAKKENGVNDFYYFRVSQFLTIAAVSSPVIWSIKLALQARDRAEILHHDFYRRFMVRTTIENDFFGEGTKRIELLELYTKAYMTDSPAEMLMRLRDKKAVKGDRHPLKGLIKRLKIDISKKSD